MPAPALPLDPRPGPLADLRVLDLSRVLAGPYAARLLRDLGAEVVKLEPPGGDEIRDVAPKHDRPMGGLYTWVNVGKRNVCIDVTTPRGAELLRGLVGWCDVLLENFRPGVAERLGVGWEDVHAVNPRAVMISINGFGSDSSWRDRRAFAPVLHAASGILHDQAERTGLPVAQLAQAYGDMVTALHATVAILAALRVRDRCGEGEHIELAMFDAVMATYTETCFALLDPPEGRDTGPIFDAGPHGLVTLAGTPQHCWRHLSARHPELRDGAPAGADLATKARLRRQAIEAWMTAQPSRDELIRRVEEAGIACAAVERLRDAATGPLARERGVLVEVDDRQGGTRPVVRSPWRFSRSGASIRGPAPRRGEHNAAVLGEVLGLGDGELRRLAEEGVLSAEDPDGGMGRGGAGGD